jgi:NCAIR mutase (PurE)-related protein
MLDEQAIRTLLTRVARREEGVDDAIVALRSLPFEDLGFAKIDHHRTLRRGHPEVIYCAGKTPDQVAQIASGLIRRGPRLLGTRATREHFEAALKAIPDLKYDDAAHALWLDREPERERVSGVVVVAAGTSDLPVAEEAALTLDLMGHSPLRIYDVGIAGLHRLLSHVNVLHEANVIVVIAGMEGALPGVVAGLVAAPVIGVPTSVGYGASFGGLAALLGMLNSCSPGVSVVNIDNGFGAGYMAASINGRIAARSVNTRGAHAGSSHVV